MEELGLDVQPSAIAGRFSATVDPTWTSSRCPCVGSTPEEARDLANAVVDAVVVVAGRSRPARPTRAARPGAHRAPRAGAAPHGSPFTPDYLKAALQGAGGGLVLAYAFLIASSPHRPPVRSVKRRRGRHRRAVLGIIPKEDALARDHRGVRGDLGQAAESFRQLRTNLRFVDVDNEPRRIVVTSALAGEGKSTVSANLARLVAQAGTKVS